MRNAHIIITSYEEERIKMGLKYYPSYKIYVGYNKEPYPGDHEAVAKETEYNIVNILTEMGELTQEENELLIKEIEERFSSTPPKPLKKHNYSKVEFFPVNFYNFRESLLTLYEIMYKEIRLKNRVVINVSGGTRPVALASVVVSMILGGEKNCTPFYFLARKWQKDEKIRTRRAGIVTGEGVMGEEILILPIFDLSDLIPGEDIEQAIILSLREKPLRSIGEIAKKIRETFRDVYDQLAGYSKEIETEKAKRLIIAKLNHYVRKLAEDKKLINKRHRHIELTDIGKLIADFLNIKRRIDELHKI